jgi:pyruvate-ferredoxin/flavodoxin oxidoreductase
MAKKMKTIDGNTAAAHVAYAMSDVAAIYPITPSSPIGEICDEWAANGRKNVFGQTCWSASCKSEAGAAAAVHGSLAAGALTSTYTASQGLLLMIPNMYKMSGELLPGVFACHRPGHRRPCPVDFRRPPGCHGRAPDRFRPAGLGSVQEAMDLGWWPTWPPSSQRALPALFRRIPDLSRDPENRNDRLRRHGQTGQHGSRGKLPGPGRQPGSPELRGTAQNPDIYFQGREAANPTTQKVPDIVADYMKKVSALTGRKYKPCSTTSVIPRPTASSSPWDLPARPSRRWWNT